MSEMTHKEVLSARRRKAAMDEVRRDGVVAWPLAMRSARAMSNKALERAAQGCTELTCLYHGAINEVRRQRETEEANG